MSFDWGAPFSYERDEYRCAVLAAEDAGELDDYYAERDAAKRDWDRDEAEHEAYGPFEGFDEDYGWCDYER